MAKILVVDDEEPIVALLRDILEDEGYAVLEAYNGRDGLALAQTENPDLVLSDVMMPLMDGIQLARLLHETPETAEMIVVLMSAARPPDVQAVGAAAFLGKPFAIERVNALIVELLAGGTSRMGD